MPESRGPGRFRACSYALHCEPLRLEIGRNGNQVTTSKVQVFLSWEEVQLVLVIPQDGLFVVPGATGM